MVLRYIKSAFSLFTHADEHEEIDPLLEDSNYITEEDSAATIEVRIDKHTGDFNILVSVNDPSEETSDTLSLLLYLLNSGSLVDFFTEAYKNWAEEDLPKQKFVADLYLKWLKNNEDFQDEYEKLAVNPSNVFGLNTKYNL